MKLPDTISGFDFHCHVDLHNDPVGLIAECDRLRIFTVAVTTTPKAFPQNRRWAASSQYVKAAVGLHPELAAVRSSELDLVRTLMRETPFVGEVGLDGSPDHKGSLPAQMKVFSAILDEAESLGGKILTIHSRRAASAVIDLIGERTRKDRVTCILHWFSGTEKEMLAGIAAGCMFSINPAMLSSKNGRAIIEALPADRILTETDAPFAEFAGRAAKPVDVVEVGLQLGRERRLPKDSWLLDNSRHALGV